MIFHSSFSVIFFVLVKKLKGILDLTNFTFLLAILEEHLPKNAT